MTTSPSTNRPPGRSRSATRANRSAFHHRGGARQAPTRRRRSCPGAVGPGDGSLEDRRRRLRTRQRASPSSSMPTSSASGWTSSTRGVMFARCRRRARAPARRGYRRSPFLLRNRSLEAVLPDRLPTHHPPPFGLVYTASKLKSCDDSDRRQLRRTHPLELRSFQAQHTPCTVGGSSGRPDRTSGMYPFGWV
jgi:hypothetical protein